MRQLLAAHGILVLLLTLSLATAMQAQGDPPNILIVIADDLGVDVSRAYRTEGMLPTTPTLDALQADGITFENVFAAPKCTPSRAAILSGKFGVKTGVTGTPGNLDLDHSSLFTELEARTNGQYADAAIGKWHLSSPQNPYHPVAHGTDYFMGIMGAMPDDYYAWLRTENGNTTAGFKLCNDYDHRMSPSTGSASRSNPGCCGWLTRHRMRLFTSRPATSIPLATRTITSGNTSP